MHYYKPYLDSDGIHIPTYQERMDYLVEQYKNIFGQSVYMGADSPDYQLLSVFAKSLDDLQDMIVDSFNSRNPDYATGAALDMLLTINGLTRNPATYSTVEILLSGTPGTEIPAGVVIGDENDVNWSTAEPCALGNDGTATVNARCQKTGNIHADANTITRIQTPILNLESATNPSASIPGTDVETDASARLRQKSSSGVPSRSVLDGINDALINIHGVTFARVVENNTGSTSDDGLSIPSHSICAIVDGGDEDEIAKTIYQKKSPGIGIHGDSGTYGNYTDGFGVNHEIHFKRPAEASVSVEVEIRPLNAYDAQTVEEKIPELIAGYINSLGIGESLQVPVLYGVAFSANQGESLTFTITSIEAKKGSGTATDDTITATLAERLSCSKTNVTITYPN